MKAQHYFILMFIVVLAAFISTPALCGSYVVNQAGGAGVDYTDLNACLTAINSSSDADNTITFTDAAAVTYTLSPAEQSIGNGTSVTMLHATPDIVTISGRLNVANGGGTFTATNIHFQASGQWVFIHGYDGQTYTNCKFGPQTDNGLVIRGGTNTLTNCTFDDIVNSAIIVSGGTTTVDNGTWTQCGRVIFAQDDWNNIGHVTFNGGSASAVHPRGQQAFALSGYYMTVNNFNTTGYATVFTRDWESGTNISTFEANNCQFTGVYDRVITSYINNAKISYATLDDCLFEGRADAGGDIVVIDGRGSGDSAYITLNGCTIRYLNTAGGSGAVCWAGGHLTLNNCVVDGSSNSLLCNGSSVTYTAELVARNCVFVNNTGQVSAVGDYANSHITIQNSIVDASNVGGINGATDAVILVQNNMTNVSGDNDGDDAFTGDPKFVNGPADAGADDYHIALDSDCVNMGIATALTVDIDGETRPLGGLYPDVGLDEVDESASVRSWKLY